jgi:hypothetical protein
MYTSNASAKSAGLSVYEDLILLVKFVHRLGGIPHPMSYKVYYRNKGSAAGARSLLQIKRLPQAPRFALAGKGSRAEQAESALIFSDCAGFLIGTYNLTTNVFFPFLNF